MALAANAQDRVSMIFEAKPEHDYIDGYAISWVESG
jgi:hypothetical protein